MSNPVSTTSASPERSHHLSAGPGLLLVLATLVILVTGYMLWQSIVVPYQQVEITAPAELAESGGCQPRIQIEHPARLSLSDQGVQSAKRIVLTLKCAAPLTRTVPVTLQITSSPPNWLRFLDAQGTDMPPSLVVQIPPGGQGRVSLYPECLNRAAVSIAQLELAVTSISADEPAARFSIALESRLLTLLRHIVGSTLEPLSAGQLTILGSLAALLWRWWGGWNKKQREFSDLYEKMLTKSDDLAALRELYSRYESLQGAFPLNLILKSQHIETLRRVVEADGCLRRAVKSLESGGFEAASRYRDALSKWDGTHWAVPVLESLVSLLDEDGDTETKRREHLECLKKAWGEAKNWPQLRCQMVRAISRTRLPQARTFLEKLDDPATDVRVKIAWALSGRERPFDLDQRLQRLVAAPPHDWLYELGFLDPFGGAIAEGPTLAAESFIWEHPLYEQLYEPVHTILLAPSGGGKTTARLALERRFWGTMDAFMLDYTDLHDLVARPSRITARRHVAAILRCAARAVAILLLDDPRKLTEIEEPAARWLIYRLLMNHLSDPYLTMQVYAALPDSELPDLLTGRLPAEAMNDLVAIVQSLDFDELYLLVDKLNNLPEARDTVVAEALFRHLLSDSAFLQVPHLHVKLFLPAEWEQIVVNCSGLCSGYVHLRKLEWDEESLEKMLKDRLLVTGIEGLGAISAMNDTYIGDLDAALAREASGSPRLLVELGETLLRLRALAWEEAAPGPEKKPRLQTEDWAAMLEYSLRRTAEQES